jgi:ABC transport system ATP-binding/permease protein
MPLLTLRNIQLAYGAAPLLDGVNLSIEPGERLCLVGRNGAGKSTLMKLIAGEIQADDGDLEKQPGLTIARLVQEVPPDTEGSVFDVVARGFGDLGAVLPSMRPCR